MMPNETIEGGNIYNFFVGLKILIMRSENKEIKIKNKTF